MSGYCGICNTHYNCHYTEHDEECKKESEKIKSDSIEDFERQRQKNNWTDDMAEKI